MSRDIYISRHDDSPINQDEVDNCTKSKVLEQLNKNRQVQIKDTDRGQK